MVPGGVAIGSGRSCYYLGPNNVTTAFQKSKNVVSQYYVSKKPCAISSKL